MALQQVVDVEEEDRPSKAAAMSVATAGSLARPLHRRAFPMVAGGVGVCVLGVALLASFTLALRGPDGCVRVWGWGGMSHEKDAERGMSHEGDAERGS